MGQIPCWWVRARPAFTGALSGAHLLRQILVAHGAAAPRWKPLRPILEAIQDCGCGFLLPETSPPAASSTKFSVAQYSRCAIRVSDSSASSIARAACATGCDQLACIFCLS